MIDINCQDLKGNSIHHFTQWDINQKIVVNLNEVEHDSSTSIIIHFCNKNSTEALGVEASLFEDNKYIVEIPNILLTTALPLQAFLFLSESDGSGKTIKLFEFPVRKKIKPSDYLYEDNVEVIYVKDLIAKIENMVVLNIDEQNPSDDKIPSEKAVVGYVNESKADKSIVVQSIKTGYGSVTIDNIVSGDAIEVTVDGLDTTTGQIYSVAVDGNNSNYNKGQVNIKNGSYTFYPDPTDSSVTVSVVASYAQVNNAFLTVEYYQYKVLLNVIQEHSEEFKSMQNELNNKVDASEFNAAIGLKANISDLAYVATSGDYNDLRNTPAFMYDIDDDGVLFITSDVLPD